MIRSRFVLGAVFIVIGGFLWFGLRPRSQSSGQYGIKVGFQGGDRAPDFDLRSLDGSRLKSSELRGKPVLLNFWATWCAPCRIEMPWLVELDEKYRAQGLRIVGISMDDSGDTQEVADFAKERGVRYQVLMGDSAIADAYGGVRFMPQSFFIDSAGRIAQARTGLTDKKDLEDSVKGLFAGSQVAQGVRP
jgi:peroxiredoxin